MARFNGGSDSHGEERGGQDIEDGFKADGYRREFLELWYALDRLERSTVNILNSRVINLAPVEANVPSLQRGYRDGPGLLPNIDFRHF